jgi:ATP-dependent Zn protease
LIVIVLLVYLASSQLHGKSKDQKRVTLSEFIGEVKTDQVQNADFNPNKRQITFQLKDGKKGSVH